MNKEGLIYFSNLAYELGKWAFIIIIIGTLMHYFLATIFVISGPSMEVEFHDGQIVMVSRIGLFTGAYQRGDPMVLKFPGDPEKKKYIKRLIGLPGETVMIKDNDVFINNKKLTETYVKPVDELYEPYYYEVPDWEQEAIDLHAQGKVLTKPDMTVKLGKDDYFFMGDNRENSNDSRKWYAASRSDIVGPVRFIMGQLNLKRDDCMDFCTPQFTLRDWGPVALPYYGNE